MVFVLFVLFVVLYHRDAPASNALDMLFKYADLKQRSFERWNSGGTKICCFFDFFVPADWSLPRLEASEGRKTAFFLVFSSLQSGAIHDQKLRGGTKNCCFFDFFVPAERSRARSEVREGRLFGFFFILSSPHDVFRFDLKLRRDDISANFSFCRPLYAASGLI